ncbi:MAG: polyketide cyclase [Flavobacteriaceae bacterium]|nr:polyketide cyclase [Flavobacteriaceae bacterium]
MRWLRFVLIFFVILGGGYTWLSNNYADKEVFVIEKEVPYPVEKVFVQLSNFQNFSRWNYLFSVDEKYNYTYFLPYEGVGSSVSFVNSKNKKDFGQMFIREVVPLKSIKYELYRNNDKTPYKINVKFIGKGEKTKLVWGIETPEISLMERWVYDISQHEIKSGVEKSMRRLTSVLSGKVEQEVFLSQIKYDSIIVENQEERLLLGLNVSTSNTKGNLFKNINLTHQKLISFITKDLAKREDEFGQPTLMTEAGGLKNREVSYFYGVPVSKSEKLADNNFVFKKQNKMKVYSIYYKGKYDNRTIAIGQLLNKIKKDSLRSGMLEELFIEEPDEERDVVLKISFPVFEISNE